MFFVFLFVTSNFLRFAECGTSDWPPVTILVNRVELQTTNNNAKYYYAEGDDVDVRCFSEHWVKCDIWLEHEHAKILREMYKVDWSYYGVGFRAFLGVTHNNMIMTCNCAYQVEVKFVLQETFVDVIKVNDVIVRNMKDETNSYTYYCFDSSSLQIEFVNSTNNNGNTGAQISGNDTIKKITTCEESTVSLWNNINITLKQYPYWFNDSSPMPYLNLTANKILLNLYTINQDQFIYYGFEDGDNLTLSCSTTKENTDFKYYMSSGAEEGEYYRPIAIVKPLNSFDENTTLECNEDYRNWIWHKRQIKVLFHKITKTSKSYQTTTAATPLVTAATTVIAADTSIWPIIFAVGGMICILVCIIIIIKISYWKRERKPSVQQEDSVNESHEFQADTMKIDKSIDRTLSMTNPLATKDSESENLYSEPYEFQMKTNQTVPEINYAVLNISPIEEFKKINTETHTPYAQIHYIDEKNLDTGYVNIEVKK